MALLGYFWDSWPYFAGKLFWDITTTQVNSALHPSGVAKSSTSFGYGKGRKVTAVWWQVTVWSYMACGFPLWSDDFHELLYLLYFTLLFHHVSCPLCLLACVMYRMMKVMRCCLRTRMTTLLCCVSSLRVRRQWVLVLRWLAVNQRPALVLTLTLRATSSPRFVQGWWWWWWWQWFLSLSLSPNEGSNCIIWISLRLCKTLCFRHIYCMLEKYVSMSTYNGDLNRIEQCRLKSFTRLTRKLY